MADVVAPRLALREHTISETDAVSIALVDAAERWPGLDSPELLQRLVSEGGAALRASAARQTMIEMMIDCASED